MKNKSGKLLLETKAHVEAVIDAGQYTYFVPLPPLEEMVKNLPSPLLEDIYHAVNMELQCRDSKWIEENLK